MTRVIHISYMYSMLFIAPSSSLTFTPQSLFLPNSPISMAIWLRKSRSIILHSYLKTRIGLLGIDPNLQRRSLLSSLFHCGTINYPAFLTINGINQTTKSAFPATATLLISRGFKYVKAGEQIDSHFDEDHEAEDEIQVFRRILSQNHADS